MPHEYRENACCAPGVWKGSATPREYGSVSRRHSAPPDVASSVAPVHAVAALPFDNLSGDPKQEYFVDGMTEAIINNLAQISSLTVIYRQAVMQYKEKRKPLAAIARELNVDAIIEGGVVKSGGRVTLYVQLVDPATERHLWTANYERNIDQVTTAQSDIARAVANGIRVRLTPQEQARLSRSESVDPEAYESY